MTLPPTFIQRRLESGGPWAHPKSWTGSNETSGLLRASAVLRPVDQGHRRPVTYCATRSHFGVHRGLLTPTEPSFGNCSIRGIHSMVFGSAFTQLSRSQAALFSAVI